MPDIFSAFRGHQSRKRVLEVIERPSYTALKIALAIWIKCYAFIEFTDTDSSSLCSSVHDPVHIYEQETGHRC